MKKRLLKIMPIIILGLILSTTTNHAQEGNQQSEPFNIIASSIHYGGIEGDEEKFSEDQGIQEGWSVGLDKFILQRIYENDVSLYLEGRAIVPEEDIKLRLELTKADVGFIHAGYTEYRNYFDGTGGFFKPFSASSFDLNNDMHLDIGNLSIDMALILPTWPKLKISYEHHIKEGKKSLIEWGRVTEGGTIRNIFPAFKEIDEETDMFMLEINHGIGKVQVGNQFRYEHYSSGTTRSDEEQDLDTDTAETTTVSEGHSHDAFSNTFHMYSHVNEKLYWSLGYLFTTLQGDEAFRMITDPFGPEPFDKNWLTRSAESDQDSHVINVNALFGPFRDLTFYAGLQAEMTETEGNTDGVLTETLPVVGTVSPEAVIISRTDKESLEETAGARYTGIPYTTFYAEGKWSQQNIDLFERELEDSVLNFERSTDTGVERQRYTLGFNTSPIPKAMFSARYRRRCHNNDYNHLLDTEPGYSAFISAQDVTTDRIIARLSLRPLSRVQISLQYQLITTDIDTDSETTHSSSIQSGDYNADIYSVSTTVTPLSRLYFTGFFSHQDVRGTAFNNDVSSVTAYEGDIYMILLSGGYAIDDKTDLKAEYLYLRSDNFNDNSTDSLPLGLDNQRHGLSVSLSRRIAENIYAQLRYGYYSYNEESNGSVDDYKAHLVGTSWVYRF
jgi:hypothetical protein